MNACATKAIRALLTKAESAWTRGGASRAVTLSFTDASFPDYAELPSREARTAMHAELRNAQRAGALEIEWDRHAGEDGRIVRLLLVEPEALATFLGVAPLWRLCDEAALTLALNADSPPAMRAVYEAWCAGKQARNLGPHRVQDFVDAQRVIDACRVRGQVEDIALRRLSVELFRNTKRIEAITPALDALAGDLSTPRPNEEVWASLGLVKFPQPILCAGNASFRLRDGTNLSLPQPYLGVPPSTIVEVQLPGDCPYVLSVENLTTFHELAQRRAGAVDGLVVYCAGMPSPTMLRVYRQIVRALPAGTPIWHWGDIDVGGFRIASALQAVAADAGRAIALFNMNSACITGVQESRTLDPAAVRDIARLARSNGWMDEAAGIEQVPLAYEQEALQPRLPIGLNS